MGLIRYPRSLWICNLIHKSRDSVKVAICCVVSTISTEAGKIISSAVMVLGPLTQMDASQVPYRLLLNTISI